MNHSGNLFVFTRLFLIGAWLSNCYESNAYHIVMSSSILNWPTLNVSRSFERSVKNNVSSKFLKQRYEVMIYSYLEILQYFTIYLPGKANWKVITY